MEAFLIKCLLGFFALFLNIFALTIIFTIGITKLDAWLASILPLMIGIMLSNVFYDIISGDLKDKKRNKIDRRTFIYWKKKIIHKKIFMKILSI